MLEIIIGLFLVVISVLPGFEFRHGRLGTTQETPKIEPAWIGRLIILGFGVIAILDGFAELRHR